MNINPINYASIPVQETVFPDLLAEYYRPQQLRQKQQIGEEQLLTSQQNREMGVEKIAGQKLSNQEQELVNALTQQFGVPEKQAKIALMQAQARHQDRVGYGHAGGGGSGGRAGITANQRLLNSMTAAQKNDLAAVINGSGIDPIEFYSRFTQGETPAAIFASHGVDPSVIEKEHFITNPNLTKMQNRAAVSAGLEVFDKYKDKAMEKYPNRIFGYAPGQVYDSLLGGKDKEEDLADFAVARLLEDEAAVMAITKSGGNVNMHAVDNMVNKAMGNTKVIEANMSPSLQKKIRDKYKQVITEAADAERNAFLRPKNSMKNEQQTKSKAQSEALRNAAPQNQSGMITIRNPKTGETKTVTVQEAQSLGARGL